MLRKILAGLLAFGLVASAHAADQVPLKRNNGVPAAFGTGDTVGVAHGGTGLTSLTAHCVTVGAGTSAAHLVCPTMSGYVLTDNGPGSDPSFQAATGGGGAPGGSSGQIQYNNAGTFDGVAALTCSSHQWLNVFSNSPACTQPAFTDISGGVAASQLPNPTASTLGGVESVTAASHKWINAISTSGVPSQTQPACADISDATTFCNLTATNGITLANIAQIGANTILGNATSGTANIAAQSMPSCSGASNALKWTTNTGFGCNTISGGGTSANPTATAGPSAVNGSASTYMRSDAAPAVQLGTNAAPGLLQGDGVSTNVSGGVVSVIGAPIGVNYSTPSLASFTWVNQGTSTATQTVANQSIMASPQNNTSVNWRLLTVSAPATPYKVRARILSVFSGGSSQVTGIAFYDGTKVYDLEVLNQGGSISFGVRPNNNINSAGTPVSLTAQFAGNVGGAAPVWLQLRNDGTTLYFDYSLDGQNFTNGATSTVGTFITPTSIGWAFLNVISSGGTSLSTYLLNWSVLNNANLN